MSAAFALPVNTDPAGADHDRGSVGPEIVTVMPLGEGPAANIVPREEITAAGMAPPLARADVPTQQEQDVENIRNFYTKLAMWGLPVVIGLIILWLLGRQINRLKGERAGPGAIHKRDTDGLQMEKLKTATQLRAAEIHKPEKYKNPEDEVFAGDGEEEAWVVGHDGAPLDFDWNDDLGFHDRRVERRERHPKDPRIDKPEVPTPEEGLRLDDAMLMPSPLHQARPYALEALDEEDIEHHPSLKHPKKHEKVSSREFDEDLDHHEYDEYDARLDDIDNHEYDESLENHEDIENHEYDEYDEPGATVEDIAHPEDDDRPESLEDVETLEDFENHRDIDDSRSSPIP